MNDDEDAHSQDFPTPCEQQPLLSFPNLKKKISRGGGSHTSVNITALWLRVTVPLFVKGPVQVVVN